MNKIWMKDEVRKWKKSGVRQSRNQRGPKGPSTFPVKNVVVDFGIAIFNTKVSHFPPTRLLFNALERGI